MGADARHLPLRWVLFIVVFLANLPLIGLAGYLISAATKEAAANERLYALSIARQLAQRLDSELETYVATLEALSAEPDLQVADLSRFYSQAMDVARRRGTPIVVRERGGQQLINTLRPLGTELPRTHGRGLLDADQRALDTGKPVTSDLYEGAVAREYYLAVILPLSVNPAGRSAPATLTLGISAKRLSDLLAQSVPPEVTASVVDSTGRVAARSKDSSRYVGQPSTGVVIDPAIQERVWDGATLSGDAVIAAQVLMKKSNWRVVVGLPLTALAGTRQPATAAIPILVLALVTTAAIAIFLGARVVRPLRDMRSLPAGVPLRRSGIKEFDLLGEQLAGAFTRQRELLREVNHRSGNLLSVVQAVVRFSPEGSQHIDRRIAGLATTQVLLVEHDWRSVDLRSLLASHLSKAGIEADIGGPDVSVGPATAQALGIAFNELAAKASSQPLISVKVRWSVGDGVELTWEEPRSLTEDERSGFGYTLVTRVTAESVDGVAEYRSLEPIIWFSRVSRAALAR